MAERSFAEEVKQLNLGDGAEFEGEAILAVTKALLQSGVAYVGGYQGAPVSHLMDVLGDANQLLRELGVHFATAANEATAAAMLAASVNYPIRGAVTWKSVVGTNVASDALSNLASAGVIGGALIIVGEDYGEGSSIIQERTHAFAMKSQIWLLDPKPSLPHIVAAIEQGFALSEATHTPVMLMLRIRACHVVGRFITKANRRPAFSAADALADPQRSQSRISLPPSTYAQEKHKIEQRAPAALRFIAAQGLNEMLPGTLADVGIVLQGGLYNGVLRALEQLGLADIYGSAQVPLYVLNVTYPLVPNELLKFATGKKALLVVEEGQPAFIEQAIGHALGEAQLSTTVSGKRYLPVAGEYVGAELRAGIAAFLREHAPQALRSTVTATVVPAVSPEHSAAVARPVPEALLQPAALLRQAIPARPPGLCTGCPERPLFASLKLLERETGPLHVSADIGCHSFGTLPPFNVGASIMGYGLGAAGASAFGAQTATPTVALMGDGGFWHNGLTSGIADAVFNRHNGVTVIIDNGYSAATGGQLVPSSHNVAASRAGNQSIEKAVRGVGVEWVRRIQTYDMKGSLAVLRAAMSSTLRGPRVIIAEGECQLNRQRRIAGPLARQRAAGQRVVRDRFGVDADICTGDRSCIRLSGCPSLTVKPATDPMRLGVVAHVDNSCVGCGVCGEVAHAATLCPSFYRAQVVSNPGLLERLLHHLRRRVIALLATRRTQWT
jgi:indolepyruvate ferredoxin oxidoreductase alpha subunit